LNTYESNLLHIARQTPQAAKVLDDINLIFDLWRDALDLPEMDRDIFTGRALVSARRHAIEGGHGLAFDPIWMAAVVCASARLNLTFPQLKSLREEIGKVNRKIVELLKKEAASLEVRA
jgi:hypothetical protein